MHIDPPRLSVVVATVRPTTLGDTVRSLIAQSYRNWELVVVGQGKDDAPLRAAAVESAAGDERVRFVSTPKMGASLARNLGVSKSRGEIVAFIDDDCEARSDWLEAIVRQFDQFPDAGLVGGRLVKAPAKRRGIVFCHSSMTNDGYYDPNQIPRSYPNGCYWAGANVAFRRGALEKIGPFDENLGPGTEFPAAEDADLGIRAETAGIRMRFTAESVAYHTNGHRYGIDAIIKHTLAYAVGRGALRAKLVMMGHEMAHRWKGKAFDPADAMHGKSRKDGLMAILTYKQHIAAYRRCMENYKVDQDGLLVPIGAQLPANAAFDGLKEVA